MSFQGDVGCAVSGNDSVVNEPDGELEGDGRVGWLERVIPLCPYVPKSLSKMSPQFWLGLQMDYELDVAEDLLEGRLKKEIKPMSATGG